MHPGYITNPNEWNIEYVIEYVDDKKTWERILNDKILDPWTVYKTKTFSNLSEAVTLYSLWQLQDNIYDCKLFCRWETQDGNWCEEYVEFDSSYKWSLKERINREMNRRIDAAEKRNIELARQNTKMAEFLKKYGVDPYKVVMEEVS